MGSETIKIYIPIEKRQEQVVEEFIHTCLNNMDSVTVDTVKKYIKSNENKVVEEVGSVAISKEIL